MLQRRLAIEKTQKQPGSFLRLPITCMYLSWRWLCAFYKTRQYGNIGFPKHGKASFKFIGGKSSFRTRSVSLSCKSNDTKSSTLVDALRNIFVAKQRLLANIFKGSIRRWRLCWWCRSPDQSLQQIKRSDLCQYLCKPYQSKSMWNQANPWSTPGLQKRFIATPASMPAEGLIIFKKYSQIAICETIHPYQRVMWT